MTEVRSPLQGTVVAVLRGAGEPVRAGQAVVVVEAMKTEHAVPSPVDGRVARLLVSVGSKVQRDDVLAVCEQAAVEEPAPVQERAEEPGLAELRRRRALLDDAARPEAVARRHAAGRRTLQEDLEDLLDPGSLVEWGALAVAGQRQRRSQEELEQRTPRDGVVTGTGTVDGAPVSVLAYDYAVLAGTQGHVGHLKSDRFLEVVHRTRTPLVLLAEGGGGRPGDTDHPVVTGLHTTTFGLFAALQGVVPRIGITGGNCFAGNAALLGCCDVVIATRRASIGMGGPAMVEGGGLGSFAAEEIGPAPVQAANGVVDVLADDDAAAVAAARQLLGLLRGRAAPVAPADQAALRTALPEGTARAFDPRPVLALLADPGSVLELGAGWGGDVVTALARLEGRTVGVLANDSRSSAGALTADGCDKAARLLDLCQAQGLPVLSLVDTPGFLVGPDAERTGLVRASARLFAAGARLTVPTVAVVMRRGYGLGAQAMMLGSTRAPLLTLAWPTAELGAMGVEGAVRLALRKELAALPDDAERDRVVAELVADVRARGRAVPVATAFEVDDVVDPAETRERVLAVLRAAGDHRPD